jgi:hypothetical protein
MGAGGGQQPDSVDRHHYRFDLGDDRHSGCAAPAAMARSVGDVGGLGATSRRYGRYVTPTARKTYSGGMSKFSDRRGNATSTSAGTSSL